MVVVLHPKPIKYGNFFPTLFLPFGEGRGLLWENEIMANETQTLDNSFMDMGYEPYEETQKKKREPMGVWNKTLDGMKGVNPFSQQTDETSVAPMELGDLPDIDVPEIETKVVDLPEQNENEKELVIDHKDEKSDLEKMGFDKPEYWDRFSKREQARQIGDFLDDKYGEEVEDLVNGSSNDTTVVDEPMEEETGDPTIADATLQKNATGDFSDRKVLEDIDGEPFDESEVIDPQEPEENAVSDEEVGEVKDEEEKKDEKKEVKKEGEEEKKTMSDEEALKEARMLAQDNLEGFEINGEDWSKLSTKEKGDVIDRFLNKNKSEDNITNNNEETTNNFEGYKRYPTGLKVAEDIQGGIHSIADRAERGARENLAGGTSVNNMVGKNAIPHYDYRRFFGR